jgi:hypothetical protein
MAEGTNITKKRGRGRPLGYRLSDETKNKIRQKRLGSSHSMETRNKISKSLLAYFKSKNALSISMEVEYSSFPEEAVEWIYINSDEINDSDGILPEKRLISMKQLEICLGSDIEFLFGHNTTPEFLMLLKEELRENGNIEEIAELSSLIG